MRVRMPTLAGLIWVLGCSSGGGSSGLPANGGTGGWAAGGTSSGGGGPLGGFGGAGGSGGAIYSPQVELVYQADCDVFRGFGVYDSQAIYYACQGPPAPYSTVPEWTLYRVPTGGAPQVLGSAPNPLWPLTVDSDALYAYFANDFDDIVNTWDVAVRRVPLAAPALNDFAPDWSANDQPVLLAQTSAIMFLSHAGKTITQHPKPDGGFAFFANDADPHIKAGWTDGSIVGWVTDYEAAAPTTFQVPITGGALQMGFAFPETCSNFFRDNAANGWLATCGKSAGATMLDVLRFDAAGTMSVVAESAFPYASWFLWNTFVDQLYWQEGHGYDGDAQVAMVDASGQVGRIPIGDGDPVSVVDGFIYFERENALWRVAATEAR